MILDAVFHILNFLLLVAVVRYLFNRYLKFSLLHMIAADQAHQSNILRRHDQLKKQEQGLVRAYYHQNYRYEELSHKVEMWNVKIEGRSQLRIKESEHIARQLEQRYEEQEALSQSRYFCECTLPSAALLAEQQLRERFASDAEKNRYLKQILASVE